MLVLSLLTGLVQLIMIIRGAIVEHWTCNHYAVDSILNGAKLHSNLWQLVHTSVTKQYNLVPVKGP